MLTDLHLENHKCVFNFYVFEFYDNYCNYATLNNVNWLGTSYLVRYIYILFI